MLWTTQILHQITPAVCSCYQSCVGGRHPRFYSSEYKHIYSNAVMFVTMDRVHYSSTFLVLHLDSSSWCIFTSLMKRWCRMRSDCCCWVSLIQENVSQCKFKDFLAVKWEFSLFVMRICPRIRIIRRLWSIIQNIKTLFAHTSCALINIAALKLSIWLWSDYNQHWLHICLTSLSSRSSLSGLRGLEEGWKHGGRSPLQRVHRGLQRGAGGPVRRQFAPADALPAREH